MEKDGRVYGVKRHTYDKRGGETRRGTSSSSVGLDNRSMSPPRGIRVSWSEAQEVLAEIDALVCFVRSFVRAQDPEASSSV